MRLATHDSQEVPDRAYERRHEGISDVQLAILKSLAEKAVFSGKKLEIDKPSCLLDLIARLEAAEKKLV